MLDILYLYTLSSVFPFILIYLETFVLHLFFQYFIGKKVQLYFQRGCFKDLNNIIKISKESNFHFTLLKKTYYSELHKIGQKYLLLGGIKVNVWTNTSYILRITHSHHFNQITPKGINKANKKFSPPLGKKGPMTRWSKNSTTLTDGRIMVYQAESAGFRKQTFFHCSQNA